MCACERKGERERPYEFGFDFFGEEEERVREEVEDADVAGEDKWRGLGGEEKGENAPVWHTVCVCVCVCV